MLHLEAVTQGAAKDLAARRQGPSPYRNDRPLSSDWRLDYVRGNYTA
jgi:hypothetical protein